MKQIPITEQLPDFASITNERERVDAMCEFALEHCNALPETCLNVAQAACQLAGKINYHAGLSWALDHVAYQHWHIGKTEQALKELEQSRIIQKEYDCYEHTGWHHETWAMILWGEGKYDQAFTKVYDGIRITEERGNIKEQGMCFWALGVFYYDLKDYDKSLNNYLKAQEIVETHLQLNVNATCYTLIGLGCCYKSKGDKQLALDYFQKANEKSRAGKQWMQEARTYYEIGLILFDENKIHEAEEALLKSYNMRKKYNTKPGMVSSLIALADLEAVRSKIPKAMEYMQEALELANDTKTKVKISQCHDKLYHLNKKQENYKSALQHLEEYQRLRNEVVGEEASNKLKDLQTRYATEKSEREAEIERLRNVELKEAHDLLAEKNKEITDSIQYAKRIQNAILPSIKSTKEFLPKSFILYKPKDIIAGDFYWVEKRHGKVFFAAGDCTGHGVPGAMVSVMCSNALSRAVKELGISEPAGILNKTVELLEEHFVKSEEDVKDGMDIALCALDLKTNTLEYSGANNPLYQIRDGELTEFKADKQPIGKYEHRKPYINHSIGIRAGDCYYVFTDGFADQFGGAEGKKFKYKAFRQLLLANHNKPEEEQAQILDKAFEDWRGQLEQVDDICVIGIRI